MNQEYIQPDYNYILNQDAPTPEANKPKKKKLVYAVFVSLVALIILTIAAVVFSSTQVKDANDPAAIRGHNDASRVFIENMRDKKYRTIIEAQLLPTTELNSTTRQLVLERLAFGVDFGTCMPQDEAATSDTSYTTTYQCTNGKDNVKKKLTVKTTKVDGTYKVSSYKVETL